VQISEQIRTMPFVRLIIPFILGIFFGLKTETQIHWSIPFFLLAILFLIYFLPIIRNNFGLRYLFAIPVFLFFVSLGWFISVEKLNQNQHINLPEDALLIAEVQNDPKETEKSVSIKILVQAYRYKDEWHAGTGQAVVYLQKDSVAQSLKPGYLISFKPDFDSISNAGNPGEFDYAQYMAYHLIASQTYLKSGTWTLLGQNKQRFRIGFLNLRQKLLEIYEDAGLQGDELAVAAALSLGYKDKLQDDLRHAYSSSGAMHVLAVSGLHVGIIFMVLQYVLGFMGKIEKLIPFQVILIILFIWFYAFLTGLSPSVGRAAIMFSFISMGKLFRQNVNIYNILAASALVTLLINPLNITELGFWLSYLAVLSIVIFYKPIYHLLSPRNKILDKLWSLTAVSIAAQIGTAPLTVFYFNQFSNYFILTNIVVIPLATLIVYLAILVFVTSFIPTVAIFLGKMLGFLIKILNSSVFFIEDIPGAVSTGLYINQLQYVLLFLVIIFFGIYFLGAIRRFIWPSLVCLILFFSVGIYYNIMNQKDDVFLVYNLRGNTGINFILGNEHILFTDFDVAPLEKIRKNLSSFWLSEGISKEKYVNINKMGTSQFMFSNLFAIDNPSVYLKNYFIGFRDLEIVLIKDDYFSNKKSIEPLVVDYVILTNNAKIEPDKINELFKFKSIIVDGSNAWYYLEALIPKLIESQILYHDVTKDGAFIHYLSKETEN
jgi:competence protein ComEC